MIDGQIKISDIHKRTRSCASSRKGWTLNSGNDKITHGFTSKPIVQFQESESLVG
jgi:hypothetical protein